MIKRVDRALLMKYKLDEMGINYTFIEGINGNTPENKLLYDTYLKNYNEYKLNNSKYNKVPINSYGAYGLLMTYKNLCENIPLNNNENILIFEDDICFHKDFFSNIEKLNYIHSYDILYLGANQPNWTTTMESELINGYYNVPYTYYTYGTYGMILTPIIINKIREELTDMFSPFLSNIDLLINHTLRKYQLKGCALYPNLVIPQVFESDNMGNRDMSILCIPRKWDVLEYNHLNITSEFKNVYDNVINNKISLRKNNIDIDINYSIDNIILSKLIENKNKSFVFIIPSYNNSKYYKKNLDSVFSQTYPFWRVIYIDDASTDNTYELVYKYMIEHNFENKMTIIKNETRNYQTYSRYIGYNMCQDDEICCMLDGDDWLFDESVLTKLNKSYIDMNLLISYGQFYYFYNNEISTLSGTYEYSKDEIKYNIYRNKWVTQHLRTCEASLLKTIPQSYLQIDNTWLKCCSDMAEMYWVLELSNGRHKNVGYPTYIYNKDASLMNENSYYNTNNIEWNNYRKKVINYLQLK